MPCRRGLIAQPKRVPGERGYVLRYLADPRVWFTVTATGKLRLDRTKCAKEAAGLLAMLETCDKGETKFLAEVKSRLSSMPQWDIRRAG